jgi:hypothetical protein
LVPWIVQSSTTTANARAFIRSLNVLLKYSNMYGLEHSRAAAQFDATWADLRSAVRGTGDLGLLVGISGSHLLLDSIPLDLSPAELDFAELLNTARVGSIRFMGSVSRAEFQDLVKVFVEGATSEGSLAHRVESQFGYHTKSRIHTSESLFVQEGAGYYAGGSSTPFESQIASGDGSARRARMRSFEKSAAPDKRHATKPHTSHAPASNASSSARAEKSSRSAFSNAVSMVDQADRREGETLRSPRRRSADREALAQSHQQHAHGSNDSRPRESSLNSNRPQPSGYDAQLASKELQGALRKIGDQMSEEADPATQAKLSATFTRFSHDALAANDYESLEQSLDVLSRLEDHRPGWAQSLRPRIGVKNRIPEFVDAALGREEAPEGLLGVIARMPDDASSILAMKLTKAARCTERERVVDLARSLGTASAQHLKEMVRSANVDKSVMAIGLLSRLDPYAVNELLPRRLRDNGRDFHDVIVRQLSVAGARERGHILANSIELFDRMILPLALDEIGMSGDQETAPKLLKLADGGVIKECTEYLRVKAIEALGRLRATAAGPRLRHYVESRKTLGWEYPEEIRTAAAQALSKFDLAWARQFLPKSGLDASVLALAPLDPKPNRDYIRQRRYKRIKLSRNVPATITTMTANHSTAISVLSLDGGLLHGDVKNLKIGAEATLKIPAGLRSISMQAVVRFTRDQKAGFEMVGMALDDRLKLRRLLVSLGSGPQQLSIRA